MYLSKYLGCLNFSDLGKWAQTAREGTMHGFQGLYYMYAFFMIFQSML